MIRKHQELSIYASYQRTSSKQLLKKTFEATKENLEAVTWTCSIKKVFLEISQNSQETPAWESLFNKVSGLGKLWLYVLSLSKNHITEIRKQRFSTGKPILVWKVPLKCHTLFEFFISLGATISHLFLFALIW